MSANTTVMKEMNKASVRRWLKRMHRATKHELAMKTGLSVVTLHSLLTEMIADGEVYEGETVPSGGGRPSAQYLYNGEYAHVLVVYGYQKQDVNYIRILVVNLYGESVWERELYLREVQIDSFDAYLKEAIAEYPTLRSIGFGLPGEAQGERITMCDYAKLVGTAFAEHIRHSFGLPVRIINDVNAAIAGFSKSAVCRPQECTVGLYFPRIFNPGAGAVIGGNIYTGKENFSGELGFLSVDTDWMELDYTDRELITEKIGSLLVLYCCILAPHHIILYGDFLDGELQGRIKEYVENRLGRHFEPDIHISMEFEADYEKGMIYEMLDAIEDAMGDNQKNIMR